VPFCMGAVCTKTGPGLDNGPLFVETQDKTAFAPVKLNVYDLGTALGDTGCANKLLKPLGVGAYHCGVEVFGYEWSYAQFQFEGLLKLSQSGIFSCDPRSCDGHTFSESIHMGVTPRPKNLVLRVIKQLSLQWLSREYDYLNKNCLHFCDALCQELGVGSIPHWVLSLPKLGSSLREKKCVPVCCCAADEGGACDTLPTGMIMVEPMSALSQRSAFEIPDRYYSQDAADLSPIDEHPSGLSPRFAALSAARTADTGFTDCASPRQRAPCKVIKRL